MKVTRTISNMTADLTRVAHAYDDLRGAVEDHLRALKYEMAIHPTIRELTDWLGTETTRLKNQKTAKEVPTQEDE